MGVAVIPMTAGAGVRVVEGVGRGGDPIIIGAGLVETADSVEEAARGGGGGRCCGNPWSRMVQGRIGIVIYW